MYFPDLARYLGDATTQPQVLCVGWLAWGNPYPEGALAEPLLAKLHQLYFMGAYCRVMRGFHACNYCGAVLPQLTWNGQTQKMGFAEIWIPNADRTIIYTAPSLLAHYITEHHYLPPADWIAALAAFDVESEWGGDAMFQQINLRPNW